MRAYNMLSPAVLALLVRTATSIRMPNERHILSATNSGSEGSGPWFCHGLNCPPYKVLETLDGDIELRQYDAGYWVSTDISSLDYEDALRTGFMRLFDYIAGKNEKSAKIDMTAPVRTTLKPGPGPLCQEFTVSFYVPYDYQEEGRSKLPAPSAADVYVEQDPGRQVYVASYTGFSSSAKVLETAQAISAVLDKSGRPYELSTFFGAGYDPPFRVKGRHNEVWVPAKAT